MLNATTALCIFWLNLYEMWWHKGINGQKKETNKSQTEVERREQQEKKKLTNFYTLINMITLQQTFYGSRARIYTYTRAHIQSTAVATIMMKVKWKRERIKYERKVTRSHIQNSKMVEHKSKEAKRKKNRKLGIELRMTSARTIITLRTAKCDRNSIQMVFKSHE